MIFLNKLILSGIPILTILILLLIHHLRFKLMQLFPQITAAVRIQKLLGFI